MNPSSVENVLESMLENSNELDVVEVDRFFNPNERGLVVTLLTGEKLVLTVEVLND